MSASRGFARTASYALSTAEHLRSMSNFGGGGNSLATEACFVSHATKHEARTTPSLRLTNRLYLRTVEKTFLATSARWRR